MQLSTTLLLTPFLALLPYALASSLSNDDHTGNFFSDCTQTGCRWLTTTGAQTIECVPRTSYSPYLAPITNPLATKPNPPSTSQQHHKHHLRTSTKPTPRNAKPPILSAKFYNQDSYTGFLYNAYINPSHPYPDPYPSFTNCYRMPFFWYAQGGSMSGTSYVDQAL
ncbi:hypothetical protein HYFRA_00007757 [Hymenoscyphus fraxineus]|uniref:Uncharacterized protein n=1 Tax=Hymenoscyphus fraxineus TaxID=746836 RepID=A0A9N9KKU2_9HELO|nr:hypothetical protein HYFRA_00007757 [Hymenoscyphus fraxineus]